VTKTHSEILDLDNLVILQRLNPETSQLLLKRLRDEFQEERKIGDKYYQEYRFSEYWAYGDRVNYRIRNKEGLIFEFETDGYWWYLGVEFDDMDLSQSQAYSEIPNYYSKSIGSFRDMQNGIRHAFVTFLINDMNMTIDSCKMASFEDEYYSPVLFIANIYLSKYWPPQGCRFKEGKMYAQCDNSPLYKSIEFPDINLKKEDFLNAEQFKTGNNLIYLRNEDIKFKEGTYYPDKLGFLIVVSESQFTRGFDSGQTIFVDSREGHLAYIKFLDELYLNHKNLKIINSEFQKNLEQLSEKNKAISDTLKNNTLSLKDKEKILMNIPEVNINAIEYDDMIINFKNYHANAEKLYSEIKDKYFGVYYNILTHTYLTNIKIEIDKMESNKGYFEKRNDYFEDLRRNSLTDIQDRLDRQEVLKFSNISLIITVMIMIVTLLVSSCTNVIAQKHLPLESKQKIKGRTLWFMGGFLICGLIIISALLYSYSNLFSNKIIVLICITFLAYLIIIGFNNMFNLIIKLNQKDIKISKDADKSVRYRFNKAMRPKIKTKTKYKQYQKKKKEK